MIRAILLIVGLGAVVLVTLAVVGLPALASGLVRQGVVASGLDAADLVVTVTAEPPTDLLGLHADTIEIAATDATWGDSTVKDVRVVLRDVDLAGRRADTVDGSLVGVVAPAGGSSDAMLAIERIDLSGGGDDVRAAIRIRTAETEALIARRMGEETGITPTAVRLAPPDRLAITVGPVTVDGRLVVASDGSLRLETGVAIVPSVSLIGPGALPLELTSITVTDDALLLGGRLEGAFVP
jgi:hypothetical protein